MQIKNLTNFNSKIWTPLHFHDKPKSCQPIYSCDTRH